jgi:hypothetical protein
VQAGGQQFHVHKAVLATRSDYFATMFSGPFLEGQTGASTPPVVSLKDTPAFALEAALRWAYSDELGPLDDLNDLLAVSSEDLLSRSAVLLLSLCLGTFLLKLRKANGTNYDINR